eukprot:3901323-Prymnesium_polylepis.2
METRAGGKGGARRAGELTCARGEARVPLAQSARHALPHGKEQDAGDGAVSRPAGGDELLDLLAEVDLRTRRHMRVLLVCVRLECV